MAFLQIDRLLKIIHTQPVGVGVILEEIVLQRHRYAQQLCRVDARTFENAVNVGAVAIELCSQPRNGTPLPAQFALHHLSDVNCRKVCHKKMIITGITITGRRITQKGVNHSTRIHGSVGWNPRHHIELFTPETCKQKQYVMTEPAPRECANYPTDQNQFPTLFLNANNS